MIKYNRIKIDGKKKPPQRLNLNAPPLSSGVSLIA